MCREIIYGITFACRVVKAVAVVFLNRGVVHATKIHPRKDCSTTLPRLYYIMGRGNFVSSSTGQ